LELNQEIPASKEAWPLTQEEAGKLKQTNMVNARKIKN
jgi:hypothetical protein